MTVHREVSRQITQRTTKARSKRKEDEGLVSLRKILKEIVEKRNKSHKEKASNRSNNQSRDHVITKNRTLTVTKPSLSAQHGQKWSTYIAIYLPFLKYRIVLTGIFLVTSIEAFYRLKKKIKKEGGRGWSSVRCFCRKCSQQIITISTLLAHCMLHNYRFSSLFKTQFLDCIITVKPNTRTTCRSSTTTMKNIGSLISWR